MWSDTPSWGPSPAMPMISNPGMMRSYEMAQPGLAGGAGGFGYDPGGAYTPPGASAAVAGVGAPASGGFFDNFLSKQSIDPTTGAVTNSQGWGGTALSAASGLFNAYMGMKQYGLMKDQLSEGKKQFGLNYDAQRQTTNASLEDRQRARVASNSGAYESVGSYMDKNSIKPRG